MPATVAPPTSPRLTPRRAGALISPAPRALSLHLPRRGEPISSAPKGLRWASILFMVAIHALAVVALLPRFWSLPAAWMKNC